MQQAKVLMLHLVMDRLQAIWLDHHQREIWDQDQMARLRVIWDQDQTDHHQVKEDPLQETWLDQDQTDQWDHRQVDLMDHLRELTWMVMECLHLHRVIWDQDQTDQHLDLMENQWDHLWVNHQIQKVVSDQDLMDQWDQIHYLVIVDQQADHLQVIQEDLLQEIL